MRSQKYLRLVGELEKTPYIPDEIWKAYSSLRQLSDYAGLPLEVHQQVLRKCVPLASDLRSRTGYGVYTNSKRPPVTSHPFETRFQTIILNIREANLVPTVEDYNFILEHFAAVGHHAGSMILLEEILETRLVPTPSTYDWCLQALGARSKLRLRKPMAQKNQEEVVQMCQRILGMMDQAGVHYTGPMLDAIVTILQGSNDLHTIERMLKLGYGVDLRNPDRDVEEFTLRWSQIVEDATAFGLPSPRIPIASTSALNSIINAVGKTGDISTMVSAFEVLTKPLQGTHFPSPPPPPPINSSDENNPPLDLSTPKTYASRPNSRTYQHLIEHAADHGVRPVAQHYLLEALEADRQMDAKLRTELARGEGQCWSVPVAVNSAMFRHALHLGLKKFNLGLCLWTLEKAQMAARWKRDDITFYASLNDRDLADRGMTPSASQSWNPSAPSRPASSIRSPFDKTVHLLILRSQLQDINEFVTRANVSVSKMWKKRQERMRARVRDGKSAYHRGWVSQPSTPGWDELGHAQRSALRRRIGEQSKEGYRIMSRNFNWEWKS